MIIRQKNISFFNRNLPCSKTISIAPYQRPRSSKNNSKSILFYMPSIQSKQNQSFQQSHISNSLQKQSQIVTTPKSPKKQQQTKGKNKEIDHKWMNYDNLIRDLQRQNFYQSSQSKNLKIIDNSDGQKEGLTSHSILKSQGLKKFNDRNSKIEEKNKQKNYSKFIDQVNLEVKIENTSSNERISVNESMQECPIQEEEIIFHKISHLELKITQNQYQLQSLEQIEKQILNQLSLLAPPENDLWQQLNDLY